MTRLLRSLSVLLLAIAMLFGSATARAQERVQEMGELPSRGPSPVDNRGPALTVPHDVPVVLQGKIPAVPASYITKDLGWLELSYPPNAAERVESIIRDADFVRQSLRTSLGQPVLERVIVRVAPTAGDMARLAPTDAPPPGYASGVAYHGLHLVLLSMMAPHGPDAVDLDEVFRHELAHVALEDAVRGQHVPVWFNEGLAIQLSGESVGLRMQTMWNATLSGTLIPLSDLDRSFPRENAAVSIAYAQSADLMRFLMRRSDHLRFTSMIERVRDGQPFERAMAEAYGSDLRKLEFEWRTDAERRYSIVPVLTGGGLIWVLVIGTLVVAYVRRRRRTKAILARWEREEAIEDALRARVVAEAPDSSTELPRIPAAAAAAAPASIKIEHHGRWHTLH